MTSATLDTPAGDERASVVDQAVTDDAAVIHNLSQMNGSMIRLLRNESLGGNAGRVNLGGRYYSCAAANGYADPRSGRIVAFGNVQDVPSQMRAENAEFTLKVAFGGLRFFRIVQLFANDGGGATRLSPDAREVLEESVQKWNGQNEAPRTFRVHHDAEDAARSQAPGGSHRGAET